LNIEQLSFLEPIKKDIKKTIEKHEIYDATICSRCCCNKCKYSVEIYLSLSEEECKEIKEDSCFNCDECYYYGMDNKNLSRHVIKFKCDKFQMSNYYSELEVKARRKSFKII
jgi:hypothetical protein